MNSFVFKNKTEPNRNDEKYNQTWIAVKIYTNYDGVRATAMVLWSITLIKVISGDIARKQSLRNYIGRTLSEQLKACSDISSMPPGAGLLSHSSRVLERRHLEQSSCSCESAVVQSENKRFEPFVF